MRAELLSESAYVLKGLEDEPFLVSRSIEMAAIPGLLEVIPSMDSVGIYFDPDVFDINSLNSVTIQQAVSGNFWRIPMIFDGSDLSEIERTVGMGPREIKKVFCSAKYTVASIGFLPGFPYLKGLPAELAGFARRPIPRIHVPQGAVGIAAGQAGIYPTESPGGWNLIGTTPVLIADLNSRYFPIYSGDVVEFYEVDTDRFNALKGLRLTEIERD